MHLHFEAPPQVRAGLNMTYTALLSTVYYAVKSVVDPTILPNAGLARPLTVTAPSGTVVNCVSSGRGEWPVQSLCQRVVDLIFGALAPAVPDQVTAARTGRAFSITFAGHQPARRCALGLSGNDRRRVRRAGHQGRVGRRACAYDQHLQPAGRGAGDEYPLTLVRYELVDGSGGAGQFRGGMGMRRVYRAGPRLPGPRRWCPDFVGALGPGGWTGRRNGLDHCLGTAEPWGGDAAAGGSDRGRYGRSGRVRSAA